MAVKSMNICRQCANSFWVEVRSLPRQRSYFSRRGITVFPFVGKQTLQLSPPDPGATASSSPIKRDPGLTLGEHGIPVPPSSSSTKDYTDEKSWAETVFRTLSGGMKSDYLKCNILSLPIDKKAPNSMNTATSASECKHSKK
jgi:hypothetical protein